MKEIYVAVFAKQNCLPKGPGLQFTLGCLRHATTTCMTMGFLNSCVAFECEILVSRIK
jgi:hypothetical protein